MRFYGKRKGTRPYKRRAYRKRTGALAAPRRKAITKLVNKVLHRNVENKRYIAFNNNLGIPTASALVAPTAISLVPAIGQGTTTYNRIGNVIKVQRGVIRGRLNILPYNATTNPLAAPILVKMWLLSAKFQNPPPVTTVATWSDFFEATAGNTTFAASPNDILLPVNKDIWTVYSQKTVKIGASASSTPITSAAYLDNSPMSIPFYFDYTKHIKTVRYNDTFSTSNQKNLYLVFQSINADGSTSSTLTTCEVHYCTEVSYEDA